MSRFQEAGSEGSPDSSGVEVSELVGEGAKDQHLKAKRKCLGAAATE